MTFRPYTVARWGMYLAAGAAAMSVWLGQRAGASLDYAMLRAVFVFVIITVLAFAAEAVLSTEFTPRPAGPQTEPAADEPAAAQEE